MTSFPVLAILKLQHEKVRISVKNRLMSKISSNWYFLVLSLSLFIACSKLVTLRLKDFSSVYRGLKGDFREISSLLRAYVNTAMASPLPK